MVTDGLLCGMARVQEALSISGHRAWLVLQEKVGPSDQAVAGFRCGAILGHAGPISCFFILIAGTVWAEGRSERV